MKLRNKKTGEIGHLCSTDWNETVLIVMDNDGVQLGKYGSLAKLNEEWEDYEEPKLTYWYISDNGEVYGFSNYYIGSEVEESYREIGNLFETREEAKKAVEKLKAWERLKDKGFRFMDNKVIGEYGNVSYRLNYPATVVEEKDLDLLFGGGE